VETQTIASTTVVLLPKNRGLAAMVENALPAHLPRGDYERTFVRGEDVPMLANEVARNGRCVLAFTGDDLLEEWLAAGGTLDARLFRRRVTWNDPNARYGKPALCLIGPRDVPLPADGELRVALCTKYENLGRRFLRTLERPGLRIRPVPIAGAVEATLLHDIADFMIDIVVSGFTIDQLGLEVRSVIMTSDLALLEARL